MIDSITVAFSFSCFWHIPSYNTRSVFETYILQSKEINVVNRFISVEVLQAKQKLYKPCKIDILGTRTSKEDRE